MVDEGEFSYVNSEQAKNRFEDFVEHVFISFLVANELEGGSVVNSVGDKAVISKNKYGYFKVKYTKTRDA